MSLEQIKVVSARKYEFLLVMDECYCDIWRSAPPAGALAAAASLHEDEGCPADVDPLRNLLVLNSVQSLSAAGLRAGYILAMPVSFARWRGECGIAGPNTVTDGGGGSGDDDAHVAAIRAHYDHSFALASQYLGVTPPDGGFFLWLPVADDQEFVRKLMQKRR